MRRKLAEYLEHREKYGGLNDEELRASFLLAINSNDKRKTADFIAKYRAGLVANFGKVGILFIESQVLAKVGDATSAKNIRAEIALELDQHQLARLDADIATAEGTDPIAAYKKAYETHKSPENLRVLVSALSNKNDYRSIGPYAEELFKETADPEDMALAAEAYSRGGDSDAFFRVVKLFPQILDTHDALLQRYAWQLLDLGLFAEAKEASQKLAKRHGRRDLGLEIGVAIESGEWNDLSDPLNSYLRNADATAPELMRAAHVAQAYGGDSVVALVNAAVTKAPDDPNILLSAYMAYVELGIEDRKDEARQWFQKAISLSGEEGPVRKFEIKDILAHQTEWNTQSREINNKLSLGDMPLAIAVRGLRTTVIDVILRNFTRNSSLVEPIRRITVPVFSGRRLPTRTGELKSLGIDLTALLVLGWLELLPSVFDSVPQIVLGSGVMRELFEGRKRILDYQKSRVLQAERIHRAIASGKLKVLRTAVTKTDPVAVEIGAELANLLHAARSNGGVVLRPAPIPKLRIDSSEDADVLEFSSHLTDMTHLLDSLKNKGAVDQQAEETARKYFSMQDRGWRSPVVPIPSSPLYVDRLALTYLDAVNLLDTVLNTYNDVFVDSSTETEATALIEHDQHVTEIIGIIDAICDTVRKARAAGKVVFAPRRIKDLEELQNTNMDLSILNLIADPMGASAIAIDDRALNRQAFAESGNKQPLPIVTSLDLIEELRARDIIDESERISARYKLRRASAALMPVDTDEVVSAALRSTSSDSADLKAITASILLLRTSEMAVFPAEIPWFARTAISLKSAIVAVWRSEPNLDRAAMLSTRLLALQLRPEDWVDCVPVQPQWNRMRDLNIGGFLAHRSNTESRDETQIRNPWNG